MWWFWLSDTGARRTFCQLSKQCEHTQTPSRTHEKKKRSMSPRRKRPTTNTTTAAAAAATLRRWTSLAILLAAVCGRTHCADAAATRAAITTEAISRLMFDGRRTQPSTADHFRRAVLVASWALRVALGPDETAASQRSAEMSDVRRWPGEECDRNCSDETLPRWCYFSWTLEHYAAMGSWVVVMVDCLWLCDECFVNWRAVGLWIGPVWRAMLEGTKSVLDQQLCYPGFFLVPTLKLNCEIVCILLCMFFLNIVGCIFQLSICII